MSRAMMENKKDYIFSGWDFTPLYDYIDKCIALYKNVPEVYQYTSVDALFNGIVRPQEDGSVDLCLRSTNCQYLNDKEEGVAHFNVEMIFDLADDGLTILRRTQFLQRNAVLQSIFLGSFLESDLGDHNAAHAIQIIENPLESAYFLQRYAAAIILTLNGNSMCLPVLFVFPINVNLVPLS